MKSTLPNPSVIFALDQISKHFAKVAPKLPEPKKEVKPAMLPDAWKAPCKTCGERTGFQSDIEPYHIWCCNTLCKDYHTVYSVEEWQTLEKKSRNN